MAHVIEVDAGAQIVRGCYSGNVTLDERLEVARRMLDEAQAAGIRRLLLDFRNAQSLSGDPEGCSRIADYCMPRMAPDTRLAYLLRYDHQLDDSVEVLVRSRGMRVARFLDATKALAWLQAAEPAEVETPAETELHRAFRLVADIVDPGTPVAPQQFAAIGELVQGLLAKGVDEPTVRELAGRMWAAMQSPPRK